MDWGKIALAALALVPDAVKAVENIVTEAKAGATKKNLVESSIETATGIADEALTGADKEAADAISSLVSNTIDAFVTIANDTGLFAHSAPAAPAATAQSTEPAQTAGATA